MQGSEICRHVDGPEFDMQYAINVVRMMP